MGKRLFKIGGMVFFAICVFAGCNDKYISHRCGFNLLYNWQNTIYPEGVELNLTLFGPDGEYVSMVTGPDGTFIEDINDGFYNVLVTENTENVTYEGHMVSVAVGSDGTVSEPTGPFSAGEKDIEISGMQVVNNNGEVVMQQQSREFIVKFMVMNDSYKFNTIDGFEALFTNVTVKRDISGGFPPVGTSRTGIESPLYKDFIMAFERIDIETGSGAKASFQSKQRLIGLDGQVPHIFTFTYFPADAVGISPQFLVLDPTEDNPSALEDFHMRTNVIDPYIFTIKVEVGSIDGSVTIIGWDVESEVENLDAEEQ